jgi:hypothetical protein
MSVAHGAAGAKSVQTGDRQPAILVRELDEQDASDGLGVVGLDGGFIDTAYRRVALVILDFKGVRQDVPASRWCPSQ